jgi:hypothetical protein
MPSAWNWVTALSRVLMQWTEIAMSLAETVGEIVQAPPRRRTATLDTMVELFERAAYLARKTMAFDLWLAEGGTADQGTLERLAARRAARRAAQEARRQAALTAVPGPEALGVKPLELKPLVPKQPARQRKPRQPGPEESENELAYFAAYFASHTTEEVVRELGRSLTVLARRLGQGDAVARIQTLLEEAVSIVDAALDAEILATGNDWSVDDEPLPFMARLKADHARRMAERARGLDSG